MIIHNFSKLGGSDPIPPLELPKQYEAWVKQALKQGNLRRNAVWTSSLAAGSEAFADKIKRRLGKIKQHGPKLLNGPDHALREDFGLYGEVLNNKFNWEIAQNKSNDINGKKVLGAHPRCQNI